jgi:hypothetical protein
VDPATINAWRLHNRRVARPVAATPAQLVSWLDGVQAQSETWARWSIGLRLPESEDTAVAQAVTAGDLARTWAYGGTRHFISAADVARRYFASHGPATLPDFRRRTTSLPVRFRPSWLI